METLNNPNVLTWLEGSKPVRDVIPYQPEQIALYSNYTKFVDYAINHGIALTGLTCYLYKFNPTKVAGWLLGNGFTLMIEDLSASTYRGKEGVKTDSQLFASNSSIIHVGDSGIGIYSHSKKEALALLEEIKKFGTLKEKQNLQQFRIISRTTEGFVSTSLGSCEDKLILDNYSEAVQKEIPFIKENLISDEPRGRLVILRGLPGSGKTTLLKGLAAETSPKDLQIFLLPPNLIQELNGPEFAGFLLEEFRDRDFPDPEAVNLIEKAGGSRKKRSTVIVIEDGDYCLLDRQGDNMGTISSLLNICDGIMGSVLNIKVIVTTNADTQSIDKALLRKGRLLSHLHIDLLPPKDASRIFNRLTGGEMTFSKAQSLANVYSEAADFKEKNNVK